MNIDLTATQQVLLGSVLIPVIIAIFKKEVSAFFSDLSTYRNRRFDDDEGDPGIGSECYLQNPASGIFEKIVVKDYKFGILPSKRKVLTVQDAPEEEVGKYEEGVTVVPYTYAQWRELIKGSLVRKRTDVMREIQSRVLAQ